MSNPSEKLLIAAANGNLENVVQELKNNANINSTDLNGYAPIHCAVYNNKVEVVKYLVKMGANVLLKDTHAYVGFTPLHYASAFGSIEMVKALLLSNEQNIHCKNSTGQTPADVSSNSEVKALLLQDELVRKKFVEEISKVEVKTENVQENVQQQPSSTTSEQNCCVKSSCCKGKKIGKFILGGILGAIFFGAPALQFLFNVEGFPVYIFPCSIIIWALGLAKIICKSKRNEQFREKRGLAIHGWTVLVLNVVVIVINLLSTAAPWWILVALVTGTPLAIHKIVKKGGCCGKKEFKGVAIHGVVFGAFNIGSFVLYCLTVYEKSFFGTLFWAVPSIIWTVAFVAHVHIVKKRLRAEQCEVVDVENPVVESSPLSQNNVVEQPRNEQSTIYPQVL